MLPLPRAPPPKPRPGQQRKSIYRGRIEGLGSPAPTSLRASTPTVVRASTPSAQPKGRPKPLCPNPDCPDRSRVARSDQGLVCESCGALVQEESGLVSEQGFGETDSGRIVATGVQVGQDQTHQRNYQTSNAFGTAGREATSNNERTRAHARSIMTSYVPIFGLQNSDVDKGMSWFGLACSNMFLAGRTIESVAVASLYIACRRRKEQIQGVERPVYGLMLIDFAERLNMDVFALGKIYRDLYEKLWYNKTSGTWKDEGASADFQGMDPAVLVPKFVKELEFDRRDEPKIQYDAIQIIKRMKRDWIHHGRRPSGVCGAAVLLAARMNNYRRTTREVVLTAKVTEITLNKRLQEFHDTQSSNLSVTRFMEEAKIWDKAKDGEHYLDEDLPPITKEHNKPKVKKKRGRPRKVAPETAAEIEGDATPDPRASDEVQPPPAKRVRIDAEGYKIPEIPARKAGGDALLGTGDASSTTPQPLEAGSESAEREQSPQLSAASSDAREAEQTPVPQPAEDTPEASYTQSPTLSVPDDDDEETPERPRKRHRAANWKPPPESPAEIAMESGILAAMDETIADNHELSYTYGIMPSHQDPSATPEPQISEMDTDHPDVPVEQSDPKPHIRASPAPSRDPTPAPPPRVKDKILGPPVNTAIGNLGHVSLSPTLKADEFDSDEDVSTCELTEEESRIKERVWVSMNADWIRKDHAKRIKKQLIEAEMRAKGLDPEEEERKKKAARGRRKDGTKRPGRRGDVSYLNQGKKKKAVGEGEDGEGNERGEEGEEEDGATAEEPRTAAKSVRSMMTARGTYSRRINYDALDAIYGVSTTSEEGSESQSTAGDGRSRSQSVAGSENDQGQAGREGSASGSVAGPSTPASASKKSAPLPPSAIFRGNLGRDRKRALAAERRERAKRLQSEQKKAEAGGASRSNSRSRSASTPGSEATPENQARTQPQEQDRNPSDLPPPTPPATQAQTQSPSGTRIPTIQTSTPASQAIPQIPGTKFSAPNPTPPASRLDPQIPGIRSTAVPRPAAAAASTSSSSSSIPQVRSSATAGPSGTTTNRGGTGTDRHSSVLQSRQGGADEDTSTDDDEAEDEAEKDEDENADGNEEDDDGSEENNIEPDLDEVFGGQYHGRASDNGND